ncbi:MAG: aromatic acid/H+ symport family MFS transporter [Acetobacteraceae bacterium]|nr:aromatic acid/H+ symport family MFS transporter [Acetobacteraceae bacterium]
MDPRIPEFRAALDARPVSGFQIRLLALAVLLLMTDGYDTQAIGYVAPMLTGLWQVPRASFGPVFSAGLVGLMLGAMVFTPIADRYGPRRVLLACTAAYAFLTLATALAPSREVLLVLRFLTGLGLGGAMPNAIALVSEYSPTRVRTLMVAAAVCGFSLGGALGGGVAAAVMGQFGWQSVFLIGGVLPLVALPLLGRWLPESLPRLLADPPPQTRLHAVVAQVAPGWTPPAAGRSLLEPRKQGFPLRLLFAAGYAVPTLLIWVAFFCNLVLLYFLANWLPSVVHASGLSVEMANITTAAYQGGGTIGALVLAWICDRVGRAQPVLACAFLGAALCTALIGVAGTAAPALLMSAAGAGFCVVGGQIAANAFTGNYYPAAMRATGVGWALGMGRFGSIFGPLIGGVLIGLDVSTPTLFVLFAAPALVAGLCVLLVKRAPGDAALFVELEPGDDAAGPLH